MRVRFTPPRPPPSHEWIGAFVRELALVRPDFPFRRAVGLAVGQFPLFWHMDAALVARRCVRVPIRL